MWLLFRCISPGSNDTKSARDGLSMNVLAIRCCVKAPGGLPAEARGRGGCDTLARALDSDGRVLAFTSTASNLVPADTNGAEDVFVILVRGMAHPLSSQLARLSGACPFA